MKGTEGNRPLGFDPATRHRDGNFVDLGRHFIENMNDYFLHFAVDCDVERL
jgi:hypothetical protein